MAPGPWWSVWSQVMERSVSVRASGERLESFQIASLRWERYLTLTPIWGVRVAGSGGENSTFFHVLGGAVRTISSASWRAPSAVVTAAMVSEISTRATGVLSLMRDTP